MLTVTQWFAVFIGGGLGAVSRGLLSNWLNHIALLADERWGSGILLGTLTANCIGGFLAGVALALFQATEAERSHIIWQLAVVGYLGGLTTFSAFSLESLQLLQLGRYATAIIHTAAHISFSLLACGIGFVSTRAIARYFIV